jgi:hypothetical protein
MEKFTDTFVLKPVTAHWPVGPSLWQRSPQSGSPPLAKGNV